MLVRSVSRPSLLLVHQYKSDVPMSLVVRPYFKIILLAIRTRMLFLSQWHRGRRAPTLTVGGNYSFEYINEMVQHFYHLLVLYNDEIRYNMCMYGFSSKGFKCWNLMNMKLLLIIMKEWGEELSFSKLPVNVKFFGIVLIW